MNDNITTEDLLEIIMELMKRVKRLEILTRNLRDN